MKLVMVISFVFALVLSGNMIPIFGFFETLQLLTHYPLIGVKMPNFLSAFMTPFLDLVQLNFFPINERIREGWEPEESYNEMFQKNGFAFTSAFPNMGVVAIINAFFLTILFLSLLKDYIWKKHEFDERCARSSSAIIANITARFFFMTYLDIVLCCLINYSDLYFRSDGLSSSIDSIIFGVLAFAFLVFVCSTTCLRKRISFINEKT